MSNHRLVYRICPDDEVDCSNDEWWRVAKNFNGMEHEWDFKAAVALAKLNATRYQFPFVVMEVPCGGVRPKLCYTWVVESYSCKRRKRIL